MNRLEKIAAMLKSRGVCAALITGEENLFYSTGFHGLEGMVFVLADGRGFCHTDSRYIEAAERIKLLGYEVILPDKGYTDCCSALCAQNGVNKLMFEDESMSVALWNAYKAKLPEAVTLVPAAGAFSELREIKEPGEIELIVKSQRIAEAALSELLPSIRPGAVESELTAELEYLMAKRGSVGISFPTILISGAKTSMPHGTPGDKKIEYGDFVTIDFGASVGGYRSDMTRTFAVGAVSDEMKKIYDTVLRAQLAGIDAMCAGVTGKDADAAARNVIADAGYGKYFGHSLGHSLGILIHEPPNASPKSERELREGNVITVEPGIYLPGKFGVRIEDMVWLSPDGPKNLTEFPKELIIL